MSNAEELPATPQPEASYTIISFSGSAIPERYQAMIFSRWLRSLRHGNQLFKKMKSNDFYDNYHKFIENLLKKPDAIVRIAVLSDDHDVALGFSVSREDVLDYIHVHTDYRRNGIARALLPSPLTTFSHMTATSILIWQGNPKYKELKFNPFA